MTTRAQARSTTKAKRIFIVDDHPITRQGLAKLISDEDDLTVCGEADNAREALKAISALKPDLAIVDISMTGKTGLELIKDLRAQCLDVLVLVMSMHDETIFAERVLRAGARGYIMKQAGGKILVQAIRQVLSSQVYVSEKMSARILERVSGGRPQVGNSPVEILSDREFEVFQLIGHGLGTRQIAEQLGVSLKTIEVHRAHIKKKLNLPDGPSLVGHAIRWLETQSGS